MIYAIVCLVSGFLAFVFLIGFLNYYMEEPVRLNKRKKVVECIFLILMLFMSVISFYCMSLYDKEKEKEEKEQYPEQKLSLVYEDVYDHTGFDIIRDNETGILYLSNVDAITPLLDADGNPRKEYSEEDVQRAITDVEK